MESIDISAAGGVVWRRDEDDEIEIALVHRPKYQDWSLPKGKVEGKESLIACAAREIMEETGFEVRFGPFLGQTSYQTSEGNKQVSYWSARFLGLMGTRNIEEIDEITWVSFTEIEKFNLRDTDQEIIARFREVEIDTEPLVMLRHAQAIPRSEWYGEDSDRPLATHGEQQSKRLIPNLVPYGVEEIHTSSAVRCYETITPFARALNSHYFFSEDLSEDSYKRHPDKTHKYLQKLLTNNHPTLLCSHNPILPRLLEELAVKSGVEVSDPKLEPADAWIVHHIGKEIFAVDFLSAPQV